MNRWLAVLLGVVLLAGLGVAAVEFQAPEPQRTPAPPTPPTPLSTIAATLTIPENEIATTLDGLTRDHLADLHDEPVKCGIGRCRLTLLARRTGPVLVGGSGDRLELRLPFTAHAEVAAPGFLSALKAKGDGSGEATTQTQLVIGPDWRLLPGTHGTVRLATGQLHLGPLNFNIADLWNGNQEKLSAPLWRGMDKQLATLPMKPQIAKAWSQLFEPIMVGRDAWLVLRPERLRVARPDIGKNGVTISLELDARGEVVAGAHPPSNPATPLPGPGRLDAPSDRFAVAVPVLLTYDEAARLALASLNRKPPRIAGASLDFSQLRILPSGQDVVLAARYCVHPDSDLLRRLAPCSTGYLRGAPRFEPAHGLVRIEAVHSDFFGGGLVLAAIQLLMGDRLDRSLEAHLVFDESRQIARMNRQVTEALATPQGNAVSIAADITAFGAPMFTWTDKGFLASFSATGKTRTRLNL